jgi:outer membrane protein assembly factor BamB
MYKLKYVMKSDIRFALIVATIALLLAGCTGAMPASSWPNTTMVENKLIIANNNAVYAISSDNGRLIWQFPNKPDRTRSQLYASPAYIDESLVVGSDNKHVFTIDINNGNEIWSFDATNNRSGTAPIGVSTGSQLAFFTSENTLYALNISTGQKVWQFESKEDLWAPPAANSRSVYLPGMDHSLTSIDIESGSLMWTQDLKGALADSPTIYQDTLYLGSLSNKAYAIDAINGRIRWEFETKGWVWGSPAVVDEQVFISDLDGYVYALNRETGRQYWASTQLDSASRGTPAYSEGSIFVCTDGGFVYSINASNGNQNWSIEIDSKNSDRLLADPIAHNGLVYITSMSGENLVHAISQADGQVVWQFNPD